MVVNGGEILFRSNVSNIENVDEFMYLGSLLSNQGGWKKEIKRPIAMTPRSLTRNTIKIMLVKSLCSPSFCTERNLGW